ncbi:hypothetical protein PHLH8_20890 [Pseudomonas sp. Pc102]|uniref:hypothetical protein n=1 Tax=Pseudomonas sp. Pc102 TaxID=2678261 RepID=UPI001BD19384|nr:hypothetical protein [Pseudomonas sp. Pc102]BBP82447.1 hypothetical protein PHLH8_20890 [Pseudomonas sp. Pc102]
MGSKKPKTVQQPDPQIEAQKAAEEAARKANEEAAANKVRRRGSSLLSSGGAAGQSVISQGKSTLGS